MKASLRVIRVLNRLHRIESEPKRTAEQWEFLYRSRTERLRKLIAMNAPEVIIDRECQMVRHAIHRGTAWRVIWDDFTYWLKYQWIKFKLRNEKIDEPEGTEDQNA